MIGLGDILNSGTAEALRFGHLVIGLSDEGCHKSSMLHEVFTVGLESGRTGERTPVRP